MRAFTSRRTSFTALQVPRIFPKQANLLKTHKLLYTYPKTQVLAFTHPKEVQDFGPQTIASGFVPRRIFVAISTENHYLGAFNSFNRFNMGHHNVQSVLIKHQSSELPYRAGYQTDFVGSEKIYVDAWLGMYTELGQLGGNWDQRNKAAISFDDYPFGIYSAVVMIIGKFYFCRLLFLRFQYGKSTRRSSTDQLQFFGVGNNGIEHSFPESADRKCGGVRLERVRVQLGVVVQERHNYGRSRSKNDGFGQAPKES